MKKLITQEPGPVLAYVDLKKATVIEADVLQSGLRAAIFQEGRPIAYASKSLMSSEAGYSQIEEAYAITYGCEHFHQYLYGRQVTVITDHTPLKSIKKPIAQAPVHIQRMML